MLTPQEPEKVAVVVILARSEVMQAWVVLVEAAVAVEVQMAVPVALVSLLGKQVALEAVVVKVVVEVALLKMPEVTTVVILVVTVGTEQVIL